MRRGFMRVCEVVRTPELLGNCVLAVDETAVGAPVVNLLRRAALECTMLTVTITGEGARCGVLADGSCRSGTREELRIPKAIWMGATLVAEMMSMQVKARDIPDPLTGDLDGAEIQIDYAETPEQRFFLLAHLFGHTVQWNVNPRAFELGRPRRPPVSEDLLPEIIDYEREAASYALSMLHEIGITGVDQWFSDYTACDKAYLLHYYRTGEKRDFRSFWRDHTPLIPAQPIPPFTPTKRTSRLDGIVI